MRQKDWLHHETAECAKTMGCITWHVLNKLLAINYQPVMQAWNFWLRQKDGLHYMTWFEWLSTISQSLAPFAFLNPTCRSSQAQLLPSIEIQVQQSSLPDDKGVMNRKHTCMSHSDTHVLHMVLPIVQAVPRSQGEMAAGSWVKSVRYKSKNTKFLICWRKGILQRTVMRSSYLNVGPLTKLHGSQNMYELVCRSSTVNPPSCHGNETTHDIHLHVECNKTMCQQSIFRFKTLQHSISEHSFK